MLKTMPFVGMIVSGLVGILFVADLAAGFPFQRASILCDLGFIASSALIAYLSWSILEKPVR